MKLQLSVDLKKLIQDVRGPKGVAALTEEFNRLSKELSKIKNEVNLAQLKKAETKYKARYQTLVKKLQAVQKDLEKETTAQFGNVKKQAKEVEKNLTHFKKLAIKEKAKIQKAFTAKAATVTTKKAVSKKKAAPKKKTSKKAASASANA